MALTSPGVQVSVIDESFYTPAEPGTRPLFIVASAENKSNSAGTGTAQGTLAANAGRVYTVTSQRELAELFGDPTFRVDSNNNPIHAGELNEYGLQAAYSFLGVSNSALIVRANLDLNALDPQADAPGGEPVDGTFWLDTAATKFGIFEWNGETGSTGAQSFTTKTPLVVLEASRLEAGSFGLQPKTSVGTIGSYAITPGSGANNNVLTLHYKNRNNQWVAVGSPDWISSWPTVKASQGFTGTFTGTEDFTINGETINVADGDDLAAVVSTINGAVSSLGITASVVNGLLEIYSESINVILADSSGAGNILSTLGIEPGTYNTPALAMQAHTQVPQWKASGSGQTRRPTGSVWVKTTEPNAGASWRVKRYNGDTQLWDLVLSGLYATSGAAIAAIDPTGAGLNVPFNSVYVQYDVNSNDVASFRVMRRAKVGVTTVRSTTSTIAAGTYTFNLKTVPGTDDGITVQVAQNTPQDVVDAILSADLQNLDVDFNETTGIITLTHTTGGEIVIGGDSAVVNLFADNMYATNEAGFQYVASNWIPLTITPTNQSYYIQSDAPETLTADGALWYSSVVDEVDIMIHNGNTWVGYLNYDHDGNPSTSTDSNGPIVSASQPIRQSNGQDPLVEGDLWIDTSDLDNYPVIKRYTNGEWVTLDKTDQTTENGVLFADARWADSGDATAPATIATLLTSNYLDFDAPDPALYPRGMLLWNLRRSGFNVKRFVRNYVNQTEVNRRYDTENSPDGLAPVTGEIMDDYYPHRWVTESGNQADGSGSFGRKAQRKVVIQALQATANSNQEIRDTERNGFNLLACPGYPELIGEMVNLNFDRGLTAFVVGDTPARLTPDATTINNWGTNLAGALQDDDTGLVTSDEYLGVFYPWGFTSDNAGRDIAVPPSHMICRMIALNDQVAYPWFAPAGTRRGGITNASAVGYVTDEGEFQSVALNEGQRDTLYNVKVNPITFFVGAGLVNFGQKTRARNASALDRINVARLVIYLRSQLDRLAKPYIFEPNDKITRDEIKQQVEALLLELVGQRALYDFLVVCDESNNTPNRIDRNELYVDIAIEPVKAVEFIYIPVRLKNTGEIAGLG